MTRAAGWTLAILAALLALGGVAWQTLGVGHAPVEVRNLSGQPLRDLKVCVHTCATLAELRPNRTWRVPLSVDRDGGADLTFAGLAVQNNAANSYVTPDLTVQFEVHGPSEIEQRFF